MPLLVHTAVPNACTPKPRNIYRSSLVSKCSGGMSNGEPLVDHSRNSSFFLDSKQLVCSICHKYIFNTNHDDCITKILNKVNSRAKVQSPKIRNNNPVEPKNHTHKPGRQNGIGQRFSLNKSSAVHEKPHTPRSCLRWKPTGRIFKTVSLRWIPTGKMFTDSTTKVDSEPPNGSNDDITNPYECNQTLYFSAGTSNSSAGLVLHLDHSSSSLGPHCLMMSVHISSGLVLHLDDIRWQKRIFLHLNLQDEMNRSFIAQNSYRLERETFSKIYRTNVPSIYIQLFWNTLTHDAKTGRSLLHDNIVPKPDLALELGKSISLTKAEEEAVAREVHAIHARIKRSFNSSKKLKGIQTLTPAEQEALKLITDERVIEENPESHSGSMSSLVSPPQSTEATTFTHLPEFTSINALQLRVARLEQEMSE
ncbi:hypothetical protein Tco_0797801 [Tanacetum coccineum]